jgi:serine/threonine-protein kinase
LTAKKERILEGIRTGSDDYIVKPFKVDELLVKIESIFKRIESRREEALVQKGSLTDYNLDEILHLCTKEAFSGELVLSHAEEEGIVHLEKGEITEIKYLEYDEDQALDMIRKWDTGSFILRPKTLKIKSRRKVKRDTKASFRSFDASKAVQIADDTWWVGRRMTDSLLQTNVFLRQFKGRPKTINYLFNPGPLSDYPVISQKILSVIKDMANIHVYNLNQQDTFVTQNVQFIKKSSPKAICCTTEGNWRLLATYDISEKGVKFVNKLKDWQVKLATTHEITYISSPFCPTRSSFLTYDCSTRVLFSSELFSGIINREDHPSFWYKEKHMDGIIAYHQLHMPTRNAMRYTLQSIKKLNPPPLIIAPLYGTLIKDQYVKEVIDVLYELPVGSDLLHIESTPEQKALYLQAANEILKASYAIFTKERITQKLKEDDRLNNLCLIEYDSVTSIARMPERVVEQLISVITMGETEALANQLKSAALKAVVSRKLPPVSLGRDATEAIVMAPKQIFKS